MNRTDQQAVDELMGTAQVFVSAVTEVMEQRLLAEVSPKRVTISQLKILRLLDLTGAHNVGDVAAFLGVSDAAASKAVDRLVRRKYIRRTAGATDRRSSELSLAKAGRTLLDHYSALRQHKLAEVFGAVPIDDLQKAVAVLDLVTKGIVNGSANPEEVCLQCGIHLKTRCLVREAGQDCTYQQRTTRRYVRNHASKVEVPARSRPGVGPPG